MFTYYFNVLCLLTRFTCHIVTCLVGFKILRVAALYYQLSGLARSDTGNAWTELKLPPPPQCIGMLYTGNVYVQLFMIPIHHYVFLVNTIKKYKQVLGLRKEKCFFFFFTSLSLYVIFVLFQEL